MDSETVDELSSSNGDKSDPPMSDTNRRKPDADICEGRVGRRGDFRRRGVKRGNMYMPRPGYGNYGYGDPVSARLQQISGSTAELPEEQKEEAKFSGRCRLYVGNIPDGNTEEDLTKMLEEFGQIHDLFYNNQKNFAFLRMDTRENASRAKRELDGRVEGDRTMKVRFAPHQSALRVKHIGPWISNELLKLAFSVFGKIERAVVFVDDRGNSRGEGIVEFERKGSCLEAFRRVNEGCFFLSSSPKPVVVEVSEEAVDEDGLLEKNLPKYSKHFEFEREIGPRFADYNSFDFEFGQKWKDLYEYKKLKTEAIEREMVLEEERLAGHMEFARYKHETEQLRQQLQQREQVTEYNNSLLEERDKEWQQRLDQEKEWWQSREKELKGRLKIGDMEGEEKQEGWSGRQGNFHGGFPGNDESTVEDKGGIKIYDDSDKEGKVDEENLDSFQNKKLFEEKVANIKPGDNWDASREGAPPKNPRQLLGLE